MLSLNRVIPFLFAIVVIANGEFKCGIPEVQPITNPTEQRIVGGWEAKPHSLPWQTYLMKERSDFTYSACGGTLISLLKSNYTDLVLTAAHCLYDSENSSYMPVEQLAVVIGAHDVTDFEESQRRIGVKTYVQFDFQMKIDQNDVALIQLKKNIPYSKYTRPVCLPKPGEEVELGKTCYVSGWGRQSENGQRSPKLLLVGVQIFDTKECQINATKKDKFLCAGVKEGGKDTCKGDSGGPLVCENNGVWTQYGIVSYGIGCGHADHPGVYAKVANYVDRIKSEAEKFQPVRPEVYYL